MSCTEIEFGNEYLLQDEEKSLIDSENSKIEKIVMSKYQVLVSTVGALGDQRVYTWTSLENPIVTVILDEAGQLSIPATISIFNVQPRRVIFCGDHCQLSPTVLSFASSIAGLHKSFLEVLSWRSPSLSMLVSLIP